MPRITRVADPRRPQDVIKFTMPVVAEEDSEPDYMGFLALILGGHWSGTATQVYCMACSVRIPFIHP
ncbi:hypothetical protein BASA62_006261 [Batrachochytrium salamandrivorans]|nr:hypothetical protein BASA62_006261 [Batrachochytrium salamandrivorans]